MENIQQIYRRNVIEHNFTYHAPTPEQVQRMQQLREKAKELALLILESTPASVEQSFAITRVEESVMWANAAIVRIESSLRP